KPLRWKIGDVEVIRIAESTSPFPAEFLMAQATAERLASHAGWLKPHFVDDDNNMLIASHGLLILSGGLKIMVDTCVGPHVQTQHGQVFTKAFLENLTEAGFSPADIDIVLCTHMHFDHVGWNTTKQGDVWVPTFPNARYLFSKNEWDHWNSAQEKGYAMTLNECVQPIIDAGLADLVEMDHTITDTVRLMPTPGHTPGHVSVSIVSQGQKALITGDTVFHPVQWAEIEWGSDADHDVTAARAMRRQLRDMCETEDRLVIGTHFAAPSSGHVVREKDNWWFKAYRPTSSH
ncbi:MAG TPA: MBL fold metallo-hydrolase, partial [Alphaproteobacteria bacterium]|nr:MBL fold metallo-hydrolase [Alphaproteobacteria bacterium]